MHINIYEIISFFVSFISLVYGMNFFRINKDNKEKTYANILVYTSGTFFLEELWVIVNILFGDNSSLYSVRLISIVGCFCFLLSYSIKVNALLEKNNNKIVSLAFPIMMSIECLIIGNKYYEEYTIVGIITLIPLIISSYFNFKYVLAKDKNKYINYINALLLVFDVINIFYLLPFINETSANIGHLDIGISLILLGINILNKRSVINE